MRLTIDPPTIAAPAAGATTRKVLPGRANLITDVGGIAVGNAEDRSAWSGVTVILPDARAVAAVDVRGGAPGTRETDTLGPTGLVDHIDAIVLSGGSAFGLDAAGGAMAWLAERRRGFKVGSAVVPIVPAAILFDLLNGGDKDWGDTPPYRGLGRQAAQSARGGDFALGNAGAGFGACAGGLKGGLGSASAVTDDGIEVGAVVAVNCFGSVTIPGSRCFWAWPFEQDGEFGGLTPPARDRSFDLDPPIEKPTTGAAAGANTALGVVATNVALSRPQAMRMAMMAQDGFARAIRPVHTPFDGDVVFALSTAQRPLDGSMELTRIGSLAADCVSRAIARGVFAAESLGAMAAYNAAPMSR
ncbi:MAG: peptidase S58 family protein [Rhodospirillaceae bacterium]|nr:peptidase S58 family protein [Rhodospirillaceae bacterium]